MLPRFPAQPYRPNLAAKLAESELDLRILLIKRQHEEPYLDLTEDESAGTVMSKITEDSSDSKKQLDSSKAQGTLTLTLNTHTKLRMCKTRFAKKIIRALGAFTCHFSLTSLVLLLLVLKSLLPGARRSLKDMELHVFLQSKQVSLFHIPL